MIVILTLNDFDEISKNIKPFEKPSKRLKSIEKDFGFAGLQDSPDYILARFAGLQFGGFAELQIRWTADSPESRFARLLID